MDEEKESTISGSPDNTEIDSPVSGVTPPVMSMEVERNVGGGGEAGVVGMDVMQMKKIERPSGEFLLSPNYTPSSSEFSQKRGRGRPPGSGKRQILASLGGWFANTAGWNFTPHVVNVHTGEDVVTKIFSLSQKGPRSICILSANGAVSNVTIRQPGSSGGILTYEGRFEILSLSGSFTLTDTGGGRSRTGGLSVSLAGPDGRVIGGGVAGLLLAASPIQMVVGSFMPGTPKVHKRKHQLETSIPSTVPGAPDMFTAARPISQVTPENDTSVTPTSAMPKHSHVEGENNTCSNQNQNSTSACGAGWQEPPSASDQKPSPDINVSVSGG